MNVIDEKALAAIRALQRPGKPDLLARVVGLFESESPKLLQAMQDGLESGDCEMIRNAAHTLKSSSAYVGARDLSDGCRELEKVARDGNLPACVALADGLADDFEAACNTLLPMMARAA